MIGRIEFDVSSSMVQPNIYDGYKGKSEELLLLEAILDSVFVASNALDLKQLCIEHGRLVFVISIKIAIVSDDGNVADAAVFAAMKLLSDLKLRVDGKQPSESIEFIKHKVALSTFSIIDTCAASNGEEVALHIVPDPGKNEESSYCNVGKFQVAFYYDYDSIGGSPDVGDVCYVRLESTRPLREGVIDGVILQARAAIRGCFVEYDSWLTIDELLDICNTLKSTYNVTIPNFNRKTPLEEVRAFIRKIRKANS